MKYWVEKKVAASMKSTKKKTDTESISFQGEMSTASDGGVIVGESFQFDFGAVGGLGASGDAAPGSSSSWDFCNLHGFLLSVLTNFSTAGYVCNDFVGQVLQVVLHKNLACLR